jgi:spore germination protein KB
MQDFLGIGDDRKEIRMRTEGGVPLHDKEIPASQFGSMAYVLFSATSLLIVPTLTFKFAKQNGWISLIISYVAGVIGILLIHQLMRYYPGKSIIQYIPAILGRSVGKFISLLYLWFYFHSAAIILREFSDFTTTYVLDKTPVLVIVALMVGLCAYAIYGGVECLGRIMLLVAGLLAVTNATMLALVTNKIDFQKLLPIFGGEWAVSILQGSIHPASWFGEVILMASFYPTLNVKKNGKKALINSFTLAVILLMATDIYAIAAFSTLTQSFIYSVFHLARIISVADFFERIDPAFMSVWVAGIFGKICLFYLAFVQGLAEWLNLSDYRMMIVPTGILLSLTSISFFANTSELVQFLTYIWPPYSFLFEFFIPILLLLMAWGKRRFLKPNQKGCEQ